MRRFVLALAVGLSIGARAAASAQMGTSAAAPHATLIGRVTDTLGKPLSRAEIWHLGGTVRTMSTDSGTYELSGLPSGSVTLAVRRLGYESATFTATLRAGRTQRANLPLTPMAQILPEVVVQDTVGSAWLSIFESRRRHRIGTFLTRADFAARDFRLASDILRLVPGVSVVPARNGGTQILMTRGVAARRCVPQMFIHTTPYSGTIDDFTPEDIEALEIYLGASELPPELNPPGRPVCAAIVVWMRAPGKSAR